VEYVSRHSFKKKNGKQRSTLEIQIRAIACLMLSSFSRNPVLKSFNKAWYLSTASTVRVKDETVRAMPLRTVHWEVARESSKSITEISNEMGEME